jgi:hypothetical protein
MTNPKLAHDTDNGRYYTDPGTGQQYMSVTNALSSISKPALVPAAVKVTADTAWDQLPRMVSTSRQNPTGPCARKKVENRCGTCRFCVTSHIKNQYETIWEERRDFGSLIHDHAEAHVTGKPLPPNDDATPYIGQYIAWAEAFDVNFDRDVEFTELTVFHRTLRYAGTADLGVHLHIDPDGNWTPGLRWLWLVDFKTSMTKPATAVYQEQPLQLAALRYPEILMGPNDEEYPVPEFAGAAVLNLRADSHAFIPLPAGPDVHKAFVACLDLAYFLHGQDLKTARPLEAPTTTAAKGTAA